MTDALRAISTESCGSLCRIFLANTGAMCGMHSRWLLEWTVVHLQTNVLFKRSRIRSTSPRETKSRRLTLDEMPITMRSERFNVESRGLIYCRFLRNASFAGDAELYWFSLRCDCGIPVACKKSHWKICRQKMRNLTFRID